MKIDILNMPDCSQWLIPMFRAKKWLSREKVQIQKKASAFKQWVIKPCLQSKHVGSSQLICHIRAVAE